MEAIVSFLNALEPWHWLVLALILLIGEISTGTTFLLWPAVGAAISAALGWMGADGGVQVGAFAAVTILLTILGPRYVRGRWLAPAENTLLNERSAQLVGQRAEAVEHFANGFGAVKLGDTRWRAKSDDAIALGDAVEIVAADGTTLNVKKL